MSRAEQPFATDVWLSFAQRISAGQITSDWSVLGQFWALEDAGEMARSPVFALQVSHTGVLEVVTRSDPAEITTANPAGVVRFRDPDFVRGIWHRWVFRVRFSRTGNGELQGWRDGTEIIPTVVIPIGYNDQRGPFWKFGAYRATGTDRTAVAEYANVEVASSSLAARITGPLPLPASAPA